MMNRTSCVSHNFIKIKASQLYTSTTSVLDKVMNVDDALNVFDDMIRRRPLPSVVKFNQLLTVVTKMKHFTSSLDLFKQMCSVGVSVDKDTISVALNCCCHLHRTNDCLALLGSCFKRSIAPDVFLFKLFKEMVLHKGYYSLDHVVTYTSLVNWLCKLGRWDEVRKMIKEMDVQTHSVLVDAFCKEGKLEEAEDVMNIMVEAGKVPDRVTYHSLIDGYCLRDDMIKAITILDSMVRNILPNDETSNIVNNGYCKSLNIEKAMLMFDELTKKGLELDVITEFIMKQGLVQVGHQEVVERLRVKCQVPDEQIARMDLDLSVYNTLIRAAYKYGKADIAKFLFDGLTLNCVRPNVDTYTPLIYLFCRKGFLSDAKKLFYEMDERGFARDNCLYCTLIQGFLHSRRYDDVKTLLQKMDGRGYVIEAPTQWMLQFHNEFSPGLLLYA